MSWLAKPSSTTSCGHGLVRMRGGKSGESPALSRSGNWGRKPLGVTDLNLR